LKEKLGVSPKQYIDEVRIDKAKRLLKETSLSITQIASSVGFPDVLSFSKFFSSKAKQSPTHYRNA
jgi:transcriptional regulator GlxA family with amidase domain